MTKDAESLEPIVRVRTAEGEAAVGLEQFESLVRKGKVGPETEVSFALVTGDRFVRAADLEIFRGLYSEERIVFQEQFNLSRFPLVTVVLVGLTVVWFLAVQYAEIWYGPEAALVLGAKARPLIEEAGQLWRILSFSFVHADQLHLLANAGFLMLFGLALENAYSRWSYALILLSSALTSGLASYLFTEAPSAGASGIVFGILGGLVVFGIKYRALIPRRYAYYFGWSVLPLILITVYAGLAEPLVDHSGHLGGLVGGVLACLFLGAELLEKGPSSRLAWLRTVAILLATPAALVLAGPLVARAAGRERSIEDDLGFQLSVPAGWSRREHDDLGNEVLRQQDYAYVVLAYGSIARPEPVDPEAALSARLALEVDERLERGELEGFSELRRERLEIGGHPAAMVAYTSLEPGHGRSYRELYVIARGQIEHSLSFQTLEAWQPAYAPIFARVLASVRLVEPHLEVPGLARSGGVRLVQ